MKSRKHGHDLYAFLFSLHTAYLCQAPYANLKIHQSLHIILTIIMTFSDVLIGAALEADKSIDKDDLYTKLLSGFARSASAFDSVPPSYKAWTSTGENSTGCELDESYSNSKPISHKYLKISSYQIDLRVASVSLPFGTKMTIPCRALVSNTR